MSRDYRPFLDDIRLAGEKVLRYSTGLTFIRRMRRGSRKGAE
jgi:hypothetical protein